LNNKNESEKILREILLFENFYLHPNIIKLLNVIKSKNEIDIYYIFEYVEANLSNVISSNILSEIHIKYIIFQLIKTLKYIHSADIIHRDLSTTNIMIDKNSNIKIVDISLAICQSDKSDNNFALNDFIQTRWYRAPELLLNALSYNQAVDMWSLGCILGEMIIGKILFNGNSTINQLGLIMELTGVPTKEDICK
jgi:mitogen-activated protein kinase 15